MKSTIRPSHSSAKQIKHQKGATILIENGGFKKIPRIVKEFGENFAIITDSNLRALGEKLLGSLRSSGASANLLIIPPGENSKSLDMIGRLTSSLLKLGMKRDSVLIALGGGVIGDVGGFLASIFMRGIPLVLVPTTLLGMADSAIGGKNGIDLPEGKNLLGTFYAPRAIIIDPLLLKTLPEREFRSGLAEIIKHGVIADQGLFEMIRKGAASVIKRKPAVLKKIIERSVAVKLKITKKDERETLSKINGSSRMLLNYGHTVGHALEKLSRYSLSHGEAVAIGMVAENRVAVGKKFLKASDAEKIISLLKRVKLPVIIPKEFSGSDINKAMAMDKKNVGGKLYFSLPVKIGQAKVMAL